ncbi:MAG: DUF4041 domain-containing protein [Thermoleophilia bacterium]|nr:DUF4041 domain-containing protein [Thermoleophilia bacterium]
MTALDECPAPEDATAEWKLDPLGLAQLRFWDGVKWTEHIHGEPPIDSLVPPVQVLQANTSQSQGDSIPVFGARKKAKELAAQVARLESQIEQLGIKSAIELEEHRDKLRAEIASLNSNVTAGKQELELLKQGIVTTQETEILQEVGLYEYRHPLDDSVAYQAELKALKDQMRAMTRKDGGAVEAVTEWTVNDSKAQGKKMVRDFSKLLLRAYNAEADNLVRGMKPYKLDTSLDRLEKVAATIAKLGVTMQIRISSHYHGLRRRELELTADFINMKAEEKEREKEERARLREEQKVQQEMERERKRLEKERTHYENALAKLEDNGDEEAAARLREEMAEIQKAIEDVDYRAANIRAGYVYVISNIGTFGESVIKIGLTRRLEPMDRVRELGDASVPFRFDTHALFFSDDAVGIERELHERFKDRRVNRVNLRREFFYATPAEVKEQLLEVAGDILEYEETPEALEYRQSLTIAGSATSPVKA